MENAEKLIHDIFSMAFDVVIPVSGSLIAVFIAFLLFSIRYFTYSWKRRKYAKQTRRVSSDAVSGIGAEAPTASAAAPVMAGAWEAPRAQSLDYSLYSFLMSSFRKGVARE